MEVAVEVLWYILQYLGWEENEIEELLGARRRIRTTRGGGRSLVRRIGSGMMSFKRRRSIIREIGSRLPLTPCKKPYFQLSFDTKPHEMFQQEGPEEKPWSHVLMATLADIGQLISVQDDQNIQETEEELTSEEEQNPEEEIKADAAFVNDASAIAKISALEDELQRLKEQIAMLVTAPQNQQPVAIPCAPSIPAGAPPLPPPPPPPPPPVSTPVAIKPVAQIIRENRAKNRCSGVPGFDKPQNVPDMADVLKGLGTVKLKSVERSPGGTPRRFKPLPTEGTDPASIIAQALKKKFAHRRFQEANSPDSDKENSSRSPFSPRSPSSPLKPMPFGPHLLKSSKSRRRSSPGSKRRSSTNPLVQIIC